LAENVYWESNTDDDLGSAKNDEQFKTDLVKWADMSALNTMPQSDLDVSAQVSDSKGEKQVTITLANPANRVAFFVRAEVTQGADGNEILPITYDDNYITIFPHEVRTIVAKFGTKLSQSAPGGLVPALRVEGYNVAKKVISLK
jgi:exo-1,4-beta-D-glucosaminidase